MIWKYKQICKNEGIIQMKVITVQHKDNISYFNKILTLNKSKISIDSLLEICIFTNDQGPFPDDVELSLIFEDFVIIVAISNPNHLPLIDALAKDFNFNYSEYLNAVKCTENEKFSLWKS